MFDDDSSQLVRAIETLAAAVLVAKGMDRRDAVTELDEIDRELDARDERQRVATRAALGKRAKPGP